METSFYLFIAIALIAIAIYIKIAVKALLEYEKAEANFNKWQEVHSGYEIPEQFADYEILKNDVTRAYIKCIKVGAKSKKKDELIIILSETKDKETSNKLMNLIFNK